MKRFFLPATALVTVLCLTACVPNPPKNKRPQTGFHPPGPPPIDHPVDPTPEPPDAPSNPNPPSNPVVDNPTPPVPAPPTQARNYEYGKAVPGKPGFVTSPYAPAQGYVDIRGFPPGTEVKDPYTGKIFLVP